MGSPAHSGTIKPAAEAANVERTMHYHWLKQDPSSLYID